MSSSMKSSSSSSSSASSSVEETGGAVGLLWSPLQPAELQCEIELVWVGPVVITGPDGSADPAAELSQRERSVWLAAVLEALAPVQ